MIDYQNFSKRFGDVAAVRELDLRVRGGETLALIGPNGSGKTTTLKAAVGLVLPSQGRVLVDEIDVSKNGRRARARLGYLPQRISFPDGFTAREVLQLHASLRGANTNAIASSLERVGLSGDAGRMVDGFSGGMRQRLGIAIALLGNPGLLILDEPTSALDPSGALMVRDILRGIAGEGTTVLLSSHDLAEVEALADRTAIFVNGRMAALGSLEELARQYHDGEAECGQARGTVSGVISIMQRLAGTTTGAPAPFAAPNLESIYRKVTDIWRAA